MNRFLKKIININLSDNKKIMIVTTYTTSLGGIIVNLLESLKK